jgi:methyl-accepting chemotaxis protein
MGLWNNLKISRKLVIGFVTLIVLTTAVGVVGFNALAQSAFSSKQSNDATWIALDTIELRRQVNNYQLYGESTYVDNANAQLVTINERIAELKSMNIDSQIRGILDGMATPLANYKTNLDTYVAKTDSNANEVLPEWTAIGAGFNAEVAKIRTLTTAGSAISEQSHLVEAKFILHRVAALYYIRTPTDEKWTAFQTAMTATQSEAATLATLAAGNTEIKTAADAIVTYVSRYLDKANLYHANEVAKATSLAGMIEAGSQIMGSSEASSTYYGGAYLISSIALQQQEAAQQQANTMIIAFLAISIALGIILAWTIIRSITKPLATISREMKDLAETGDLSKRCSIENKNEIGIMSASLNEMLDNVAQPVTQIATTANIIASGDLSQDIAVGGVKGDVKKLADGFTVMLSGLRDTIRAVKTSTEQVASSAEELSSSAEEVNASMEEVSSTIQQVATGSQNTAKDSETMLKQSQQAGQSSESGQKAAKEVSSKMELIKRTTQEGAQKISALGTKSQEIGRIVDTINQISEQTNLLALNAAIEAARAGEAGRGFAVVADEVRKLAEESGQATKQIRDLIGGIQTEIDGAVKSMGENTKQVEEGSKGVEAAVTAFEALPTVIAAVNKSAEEVGAVAQENASGAEEVSASIEEVTSSMQQVSSAAQQMASIASELKNVVERFKLNEIQTIKTTKLEQPTLEKTHSLEPYQAPKTKNLTWHKTEEHHKEKHDDLHTLKKPEEPENPTIKS